jgi:hypothetical protein
MIASILPLGWMILLLFIVLLLTITIFFLLWSLVNEISIYGGILWWKLNSPNNSIGILEDLHLQLKKKKSQLQIIESQIIAFEEKLEIKIRED